MKALIKAFVNVLLIGLLVCGSSLGFASVQDEYVFAEDDECECMYCYYGCADWCTGDCAGDGDSGGDSSDPDDNNGDYFTDPTVPWYQDFEITESGDLILTFIFTGELDDLWVWRADVLEEDWIPYWNTLGSGTANGRITVVSERPEGDYLYVTIPDAAEEFPEDTLLAFDTQHPFIVCIMYIDMGHAWISPLGIGGDRTGADKFPRPPRDSEDGADNGGDNKPPYSVPNKTPANEPDTGEEKPSDGTNTGTEPPPATAPNTNGGKPSDTGTVPVKQLSLADDLDRSVSSGGSTKPGRSSTPAVVVSGDNEVIDPEALSELNAPDSSAAPSAVASDEYPTVADTAPDAIPKTAPPAEDTTAQAALSNRAFTAMVAIGIAAAILAGAAIWVKRRKLRSR